MVAGPSDARAALIDAAPEGSHALAMTGLANAPGEEVRYLVYSTPVPVSEGMYSFACRFRTEGEAHATAYIHACAEKPGFPALKAKSSEVVTIKLGKSEVWKTASKTFSVKAGLTHVVVMLRGFNIGTICFDDATLTSQGASVEVFLFPGEFGRARTVPCIADVMSPARFQFTGRKGTWQKSIELAVDLPKQVAVDSIDPLRTTVDPATGRRQVTVDISRGAERLRPTMSYASTLLWLTAPSAATENTVRYRLVLDGKPQPSKEATLRVLPPFVEGTCAKDFLFGFMWSLISETPESRWPELYDLFQKSGINAFFTIAQPYEKLDAYYQYMEKRFRADDGYLLASVPAASYTRRKPYSEKNWVSLMLEQGEAAFDAMDRGALQSCSDRLNGYVWDFEPKHDDHEANLGDPSPSGNSLSGPTVTPPVYPPR